MQTECYRQKKEAKVIKIKNHDKNNTVLELAFWHGISADPWNWPKLRFL